MTSGRPSQSIHKVFAENLRLQCARFASIAELCRLAGINRQQFNRYLSGQNLPNPRTLERLSTVLAVSEASLFETHQSSSDRDTAVRALGLEHLLPLLIDLKEGAPTDLRNGCYYCYAPLVDHTEYIVRMVIHVTNDGKLARFTRRTSFTPIGQRQTEMEVGRHAGIILGDATGSLLIGRNKIHPNEFTAVRVQKPQANPNVPRAGITLLRNAFTDISTRLALQFIGDGKPALREAIRNIGLVPVNHASIPSLVRGILYGGPQKPGYIMLERDTTLSNLAD